MVAALDDSSAWSKQSVPAARSKGRNLGHTGELQKRRCWNTCNGGGVVGGGGCKTSDELLLKIGLGALLIHLRPALKKDWGRV